MKINRRLLTFPSDFQTVMPYKKDGSGVFSLCFSGTRTADIAGGVFEENRQELKIRVDEAGFVHTSGKKAPTWWYDGFGPWLENLGNYYGDFYSRDAGRALMTLSALGYDTEACRGVEYANKLMMYFPRNNLTFHGKEIPGHCTVVMNKPMFYSEILSISGWPTQYTAEKFGADYQKIGNQETDGHGLMMMANYLVWKQNSDGKRWLNDNWNEICESAKWILWCIENPDISFARGSLLYAESEAGMNDYTLYCNIPCYIGMMCYSEMARFYGDHEKAEAWKNCGNQMKHDIEKEFSDVGGWKSGSFGFFHDPVLTFCSDIFGYDTRNYPEDWNGLSETVYETDIGRSRSLSHDASGGVGYNASMKAQSALLNDRMEDANRLVNEITRMCYAPGLPFPYIVPEGLSYCARLEAIRRQGDLGNLVQMAEVLKTYLMLCGISLFPDNTLSIFPRLPDRWNADIRDYKIGEIKMDMFVSAVTGGEQSVLLSLGGCKTIDKINIRFGPFDSKDNIIIKLNGKLIDGAVNKSGDKYWKEILIEVSDFEEKYTYAR